MPTDPVHFQHAPKVGDYAHVKKSIDGLWFGVVRAANGEPIFTTETQHNRQDVVDLLTSRGYEVRD